MVGSQVQLSGFNCFYDFELEWCDDKGRVRNSKCCNRCWYLQSGRYFRMVSTTNEQVGQATISFQYDSVTYGASLTEQFTLKKHYEHDAVSEPTIILEALKFPVFEEKKVLLKFSSTREITAYMPEILKFCSATLETESSGLTQRSNMLDSRRAVFGKRRRANPFRVTSSRLSFYPLRRMFSKKRRRVQN